MNRAETVFLDESLVGLCPVSFVQMKIIVRIHFMVAHHQTVAGYFGDNRSGRDREHFSVAINHGFDWQIAILNS